MKAVILAGGRGTRLYPTTFVVNKHLLPIYNKPMIYYPVSVALLCRIREIIIVTNPEDVEIYKKLFLFTEEIGVDIKYAVQETPGGLAHALLTAEEFARGAPICLILGDNIFFGHGLPDILMEARRSVEKEGGAYIFVYYVNDPERYGIAEFDSTGKVISLEEKPKKAKSNFAVTGLYFYDQTVFEKARRIEPSSRGELEITSVNQEYLKEGKLKAKLLGRGFAWFDAGTHESFLSAGEFVYTIEKKTGLMIGCLEEIAFNNGWISRQKLLTLANRLKNTDYGEYLSKIAKSKD